VKGDFDPLAQNKESPSAVPAWVAELRIFVVPKQSKAEVKRLLILTYFHELGEGLEGIIAFVQPLDQ
jgi:hypothetical protein